MSSTDERLEQMLEGYGELERIEPEEIQTVTTDYNLESLMKRSARVTELEEGWFYTGEMTKEEATFEEDLFPYIQELDSDTFRTESLEEEFSYPRIRIDRALRYGEERGYLKGFERDRNFWSTEEMSLGEAKKKLKRREEREEKRKYLELIPEEGINESDLRAEIVEKADLGYNNTAIRIQKVSQIMEFLREEFEQIDYSIEEQVYRRIE